MKYQLGKKDEMSNTTVTMAATLRKAGVPRASLSRQLAVMGGYWWAAQTEDGLIYEATPTADGWRVGFDDGDYLREFATFSQARAWLDIAVASYDPAKADLVMAMMIEAGVTR